MAMGGERWAAMEPFVMTGQPVTLLIDEGPYSGVQAEVRTDLPYGTYRAVLSAIVEFQQTPNGSPEEEAALWKGWDLFASKVLIGWNIEDADGPIPPASAPERLSVSFIVQVIALWSEVMSGTPPPLPSGSSDTEPAPSTPKPARRRRSPAS